jgi:hypothetical protein
MSKKALQTDIFLHRGPVGEPGEGLVLSGTLRDMMERSGNGASFSMGVLRGVPGKRAVKDM